MSSEIEVWQTMDALIYGIFCQAGERTISSRTIWFNSKGPLETVRMRHWQKKKKKGGGERKEKEAEKLCSIQNTCQELEQKMNTALLFYTKFLSHRSPDFPSSIIPLVTAHLDTEKILFFHIIGMRNGLELNSITYSNPQTNKSNIARGQNAFYVSKSQNKRASNKKISQHTVFLSYFL